MQTGLLEMDEHHRADAVNLLVGMGFTEEEATLAVATTGDQGVGPALDFIRYQQDLALQLLSDPPPAYEEEAPVSRVASFQPTVSRVTPRQRASSSKAGSVSGVSGSESPSHPRCGPSRLVPVHSGRLVCLDATVSPATASSGSSLLKLVSTTAFYTITADGRLRGHTGEEGTSECLCLALDCYKVSSADHHDVDSEFAGLTFKLECCVGEGGAGGPGGVSNNKLTPLNSITFIPSDAAANDPPTQSNPSAILAVGGSIEEEGSMSQPLMMKRTGSGARNNGALWIGTLEQFCCTSRQPANTSGAGGGSQATDYGSTDQSVRVSRSESATGGGGGGGGSDIGRTGSGGAAGTVSGAALRIPGMPRLVRSASDRLHIGMGLHADEPVESAEMIKTFFCQICFDNQPFSEGWMLQTCNHWFCKECISDYARIKIEDGQVGADCLKCCRCKDVSQGWDHDCDTALSSADIQGLVSEEVFNKYGRYLGNATNTNNRQCPKCEHTQVGQPASPAMKCDECGCDYCYTHSLAHDPATTCNDYERKVRLENKKNDRLIARTSKPCPQCKSQTTKSSGCNHMTCTIAGCETDGRRTDWCWQCGKNITNGVTEHYMGSSCGQFARDETQDAAQQNGPYTQACLNLANFVFILAFLLVCIPFWLANAILVFVCLPCHFVYVCECSDNDGRAFGPAVYCDVIAEHIFMTGMILVIMILALPCGLLYCCLGPIIYPICICLTRPHPVGEGGYRQCLCDDPEALENRFFGEDDDEEQQIQPPQDVTVNVD